MDWITIPLPSRAALWNSLKPLPFVERKQLSRTTIELSTIMPTPRTRLPSVITFSEKPMTFIITSAARMEIGIDVPTIMDALKSPKNRKIMTMETITAAIMVCSTLSRELLIISLLSSTTMISKLRFSARSRETVLLTALETSPAELFCCFFTPSTTVSAPL